MEKQRTMEFKHWPKHMLVALVESYHMAPAECATPEFGMSGMAIAIAAGVLDKSVLSSNEFENFKQGDQSASFNDVQLADIYEAIRQMRDRGWIYSNQEEGVLYWLPTPGGIDQAYVFTRPLWLRVAHAIGGDMRTVVVSAVTAVVIYFILKIFS